MHVLANAPRFSAHAPRTRAFRASHPPHALSRRAGAALALGAWAAALTPAARADLKSYTSPANVSWQNNLAWSPLGAPNTIDDLVFDRALPSFITFDTATNSCRFHTYRRNTVNVDVSGLHVVTGGMIISNSTDPATLNLRNNTLAVNAGSTLGSVNGGHGILRLEENNVAFSVNGAASLFTVGRGGAGDVFIDNGSLLECDGPVIVADLSTSSAAIHVTGVSPNIAGRASRFNSTSTANVIIGDAGAGFLNLADNGAIDINGPLILGNLAGSNGRINMSDGTMDVAGDLRVASNQTAAPTGDAQVILTGGVLNVNGSLRIGDPNGGDGTVTINGNNATLITHDLLPTFNRATINLDRGQLVVFGGQYLPILSNLTINALTPGTLVEFQLNGTQPATHLGTLQCGTTNRGLFTLSQSSATFLNVGEVVSNLGTATSARGDLLITADSNLNLGATTGTLNVGVSGAANINLFGNSTLRVGRLNLAVNPTSTSTMSIDSGSQVIVGSGGVFLGGSGSPIFGTATTSITGDSLLSSAGGILLNGTLNINNSTVSAAGQFSNFGAITSTDGVIQASRFVMATGDTFTGNGRIEANIAGSGAYTLTGTTTLLLGVLSSNLGVECTSTFNIGNKFLHLLDANTAFIGPTTIALGGAINAAHQVSAISLTGAGNILCDYFPGAGGITATDQGLEFNGLLTNPGNRSIAGTRFTFGATGGFTGSGLINGIVGANPGSVITSTGPLTMGNALDNQGVILNGDINISNGNLTLLDNNGAFVGGHVVFVTGGNALICANGLLLGTNALVEGSGSLGANVQSDGRIKVLNTTGQVISINANYTQRPTGALEVTLLSPSLTTRLNVTSGAASLSGALKVNSTHTPAANTRWTVLTCQSRTGAFTSTIFPPVPTGGFRVEYFPTRVDVVFCLSDFNGDGALDPDDLSDYIACFFSTPACPLADINADGFVDPDDLSDYIGAFFAGCA